MPWSSVAATLARAFGERDHLAALAALAVLLLVGEDRGEIAVSEPLGLRARFERVVHDTAAVKLGEVDGLAELASQPARAGRGGLGQPLLRTSADPKERGFLLTPGPWFALDRTGRAGRVVLIDDARLPRRRQRVTRDFPWAFGMLGMHDDQLLPVDTRPNDLVNQPARDGVERAADRDR